MTSKTKSTGKRAGKEVPDSDEEASEQVDESEGDDAANDDVANGDAAPSGGSGPIRSTGVLSRLGRAYRGENQLDIVGRKRWWFLLSAVLMVISGGALLTQGLNLSIEFEGGVVWEVPAGDASVSDARDTLAEFGLEDATIQTLASPDGADRLRIEATEVGNSEEVSTALEELTGESLEGFQEVGPSWGDEITNKARTALIWFLAIVAVYIAIRFHLSSSLPALLALFHDVVITVGIYALAQFSVTPGTVIAFLVILGYSLYDTVVVFDKVEENSRLVTANGTITYSAMANLSLNQALMRSVNTTITSLLPVTSLLVVGSWIMGATALQDFALALFIGLLAGAYSSFFLAVPVLSMLNERKGVNRRVRERVVSQGLSPTTVPEHAVVASGRRGGVATVTRSSTSTSSARSSSRSGSRETTTLASGRVIPARPRKKKRR